MDDLAEVLVVRDLAREDELGPHGEIVMLPRRGQEPVTLELDQVEKLAALGLTINQICDYFGVSPGTFHAYKRKFEALDAAWSQGRAKGIVMVAQKQMEAIQNKQWIPGVFYLKSVGKWREQDTPAESQRGANIKVELYLPENGR